MTRSKVVIVVLVLLLAVGFGLRLAAHQSSAAATQKSGETRPTVRVVTPRLTAVGDQVRFSGVVRPRNEVDVAAKVGGRIEQLRATIGQEVKAGDVLLVIEHAELGLQKDQALAQVEAAKAQLAAARVAQAAAKTQSERVEKLQQGGALAVVERDRVLMELRRAEAGLHGAEAGLRLAEVSAGLSSRAVQNSFVSAPIDGVVVRRMVNVGVQVGPGQPLLLLQDVAELKLEGAITASEYARARVGQLAAVSIDELPGVPIVGRVATLSPTLDPQTRRAVVELAIDNPDRKLLPNMFAHATIKLGGVQERLSIPTLAVVTLAAGRVVFVVRDGVAKLVRLPDTAEESGERVIVEGVLTPSDQVVVWGQAALVDGVAVNVEAAGT